MKILADRYLYKLEELMPEEAELFLYDPDDGFPEDAGRYDALLIRTVTKVNSETLPDPGALSFIGSATAGFDHVDIEYLTNHGITFARSEGCNANAVAEYVLTALHKWAAERGVDLQTKSVGIVGCGNTGGRVAGYLKKLGIRTVHYDPPKSLRESTFRSSSESDLLKCDILSFHVPLTNSGNYPTFHICNKTWLDNQFSLILNTSRGGVVDEEGLLNSHRDGVVDDYILDVWENEPLFSDKVAKRAFLTTPHIAGYSKEAKWRASEIVVNKMCEHFGVQKTGKTLDIKPDKGHINTSIKSFTEFLWKHSNLKEYDKAFKHLLGLDDDEKSHRFAKLRSEMETRFEFSGILDHYEDKSGLPEEVKIFLDSD